jgi:aldehyde:ferredoxin oxidoreductase
LTRADDNWPERFYTEPVSGGPAEGRKLSRDEVVGVLDEYYGLRGWDEVNGMPTERKLAELGLQDIADELKRMGKLP